MNKLLARILVVLKAAPTYLTALATLMPLVADDIAKVAPGQAEAITHVVLVVGAWITAAVSIIRRVTPVFPDRRGLLTKEQGSSDVAVIVAALLICLTVIYLGKA